MFHRFTKAPSSLSSDDNKLDSQTTSFSPTSSNNVKAILQSFGQHYNMTDSKTTSSSSSYPWKVYWIGFINLIVYLIIFSISYINLNLANGNNLIWSIPLGWSIYCLWMIDRLVLSTAI